METINVKKTVKKIIAQEAILNFSEFNSVCLDGSTLKDVSAKSLKIIDANLSNLQIRDAQLGGACFYGIGLPPKGHPGYEPDAKQRPLKFEKCDLNGAVISGCDLKNMEITDCDLKGMRINGFLVEELFKFVNDSNSESQE